MQHSVYYYSVLYFHNQIQLGHSSDLLPLLSVYTKTCSPFEEVMSTIQPHFVHFLCALLGLFIHLCPFLFFAPNFVPLLNPIITPFPVNIYELADIHIVYTEILGSFLVTIRKLPFKSACITNHQAIIFITSITP